MGLIHRIRIKEFLLFFQSLTGNRLDGKTKNTIAPKELLVRSKSPVKRGIPDYDYKIGYLNFFRFDLKRKEAEQNKDGDSDDKTQFKPFSGSGSSLKNKK